MNKVEELKTKIEKERARLNQLARERRTEETYTQSLLVDQLIAEYISITDAG